MANFEIKSAEKVNWVEVELRNETVRTESGALRYMRGNIQMESKGSGVGGFFKAALTGESFFKPTYSGSGKLVLEPTLGGFLSIPLQGETLVLDRGAYWASDSGIEVSGVLNKATAALLGGEGIMQTSVSGHGQVIICTPGPVEILDLVNDRLVVDGTFAVARSASLDYRVEKSTRSLLGSVSSGEGFVNVFEGTGRVWISPVPYLYVMLHETLTRLAATKA